MTEEMIQDLAMDIYATVSSFYDHVGNKPPVEWRKKLIGELLRSMNRSERSETGRIMLEKDDGQIHVYFNVGTIDTEPGFRT